MSSPRVLFYATLMLLVSFTFSFARDVGVIVALPWVIASWLAWGLGVAWVWSRGSSRASGAAGHHEERL